MNEIWKAIKKYQKLYILIVSALATIILVNETLNFVERIINNVFLGILSLLIFYFLTWVIIKEKIKNDKK